MSFSFCRSALSSLSSTTSYCGARCQVCTYCKLVLILERIDTTDAECVPAGIRCDGIFNEQRRAQRVNTLGKEVLIRVNDFLEHDLQITVPAPAPATMSILEMGISSPSLTPFRRYVERGQRMFNNIRMRILVGLILFGISCVLLYIRLMPADPTVIEVVTTLKPSESLHPLPTDVVDVDGITNRV